MEYCSSKYKIIPDCVQIETANMPSGQTYEAYDNSDGGSVGISLPDASAQTTWQKWSTGTRGVILKIILFIIFFMICFTIGYSVGYSIHKCRDTCPSCDSTTNASPAL